MVGIDLLILGGIAAFLVWRLWSTLGSRTGNEQRRPDPFAPGAQDGAQDNDGNVIPLPDRTRSDVREEESAKDVATAAKSLDLEDAHLENGIIAIRKVDPNFSPSDFLGGAQGAFEMVVGAFATGDTDSLHPLLSADVYRNFSAAIDAREESGVSLETSLIGVSKAWISQASMKGDTAFVTVEFVSDQINVVKDGGGRVIEGDPNEVESIEDTWTFARDTRLRDPNWALVATESDSE